MYFAQDQSWSQLAGVAGGEEGGEATRYRGDHEDRPCLKGDIHYPAASGQGVRDGQQLNAGEKYRITEAVNIPSSYAALENPDEDRANGKDPQCQPEPNEEACGKPSMALLPGKSLVNSSRITQPAFLLVL